MTPERRVAPQWLRAVTLLPINLGWLFMVGAGLTLLSRGSGVGIALALAGAITAYLAVRRSLRVLRGTVEAEYSGTIESAQFDYIVWSFIGLPVVLGLVLLVLAMSGNLD